ncbi:hypothetical protein CYMTET_20236 [Cymbomonas tetramitiformis]|uniref:RUN domain-containing protein n=1 Tax=Cymbomonas tetramitiformis TaxID=36881 RepID=A0AAE0L436_9CHLO|nr:hypothetical protein CYMTET_20236 [Cymbomonas tetramitiformis]
MKNVVEDQVEAEGTDSTDERNKDESVSPVPAATEDSIEESVGDVVTPKVQDSTSEIIEEGQGDTVFSPVQFGDAERVEEFQADVAISPAQDAGAGADKCSDVPYSDTSAIVGPPEDEAVVEPTAVLRSMKWHGSISDPKSGLMSLARRGMRLAVQNESSHEHIEEGPENDSAAREAKASGKEESTLLGRLSEVGPIKSSLVALATSKPELEEQDLEWLQTTLARLAELKSAGHGTSEANALIQRAADLVAQHNHIAEKSASETATIAESAHESATAKTLLASLKAAIKEALKESGKSAAALGEGNYTLMQICGMIEQVMEHGARRSWGGYARKWLRRNNGYPVYQFLEGLSQQNEHTLDLAPYLGLDQVQSMSGVSTEVGKFRAWLRLSLNEGCLADRTKQILGFEELLEERYEEHALLRTEDCHHQLVGMLEALSTVQCTLAVSDNPALDATPSALESKGSSSAGSGKSGDEHVVKEHKKAMALLCKDATKFLKDQERQEWTAASVAPSSVTPAESAVTAAHTKPKTRARKSVRTVVSSIDGEVGMEHLAQGSSAGQSSHGGSGGMGSPNLDSLLNLSTPPPAARSTTFHDAMLASTVEGDAMPQLDPLPDDDTDASLFGMEVTPPPGGLRLDSLAPGVPLRTVEIAAAAAATATGSPAALDGLDFEEDFDSAELISLSDPPPTITYPATSSAAGGEGYQPLQDGSSLPGAGVSGASAGADSRQREDASSTQGRMPAEEMERGCGAEALTRPPSRGLEQWALPYITGAASPPGRSGAVTGVIKRSPPRGGVEQERGEIGICMEMGPHSPLTGDRRGANPFEGDSGDAGAAGGPRRDSYSFAAWLPAVNHAEEGAAAGGGGGGPSSSSEGATGVATGGHMAERGAARNAEQLGPDEVHRGFKELVRVREEYIEPDNLLSEMQDVLVVQGRGGTATTSESRSSPHLGARADADLAGGLAPSEERNAEASLSGPGGGLSTDRLPPSVSQQPLQRVANARAPRLTGALSTGSPSDRSPVHQEPV